MIELVDRRVLGAIELFNAATLVRIAEPLSVRSEELSIRRNRLGLYVIHAAQGLTAHTLAFSRPPDEPAVESATYQVDVDDPEHRFLSRRAQVKLPRKPAGIDDPGSVLVPIRIAMSPAGPAPVLPTWAIARIRVQVAGGNQAEPPGLANVLVRLTPEAGAREQTTLTDPLGEALVIVTGVAPVLPAGAPDPGADPDAVPPVLTQTFAASLELVLDAAVVRPSSTNPLDARLLPRADPDAIARRRTEGNSDVRVINPPAVQLAAGKTERLAIDVVWP